MYSTIALDLEGTLISNAFSQFPRPGLRAFLDYCVKRFDRVVLFTCVNEERVRNIWTALESDGHIPSELIDIEIVQWQGRYKDLNYLGISPVNTLLIDDQEAYVEPEQKANWVDIKCWDYPYERDDLELVTVLVKIESKRW
ncbi:MAG: NIF family HAD-type phosphatase [Candidatus Thiodiazotropha sp.]